MCAREPDVVESSVMEIAELFRRPVVVVASEICHGDEELFPE